MSPTSLRTASHRATVDEGSYYGQPTGSRFSCKGAVKTLMDNVEFRNNGGANMVANGDFANGANGWTLVACCATHTQNPGPGSGTARRFISVAADRGDTGPNKVFQSLSSTATNGRREHRHDPRLESAG